MSIDGNDFANTLSGTLGDDIINAAGGNDIIYGSQGNDTVDGGLGNDRLVFSLSDASLFAAAIGARTFTIGAGTVTDSGATINTNFTSVENITLSTVGAGNFADIIDASGFTSTLSTGVTILLGDGNANVTGSAKNDTITTGRGDNVINSGLGRDTINASQGHDIINGEGGRDTVVASMGNASLFAAPTGSRTYTISNTGISDSSGTLDTSITNVEVVRLSTVGTGDFGDVINASAWTSTNGIGTLAIFAGSGNDTVTGSVMDDFISVGLGINSVDAGAGIDEVRLSFDNNSGGTLIVGGSGGTVTTTLGGTLTNTILNAENIAIIGSDFNGANTSVNASGLTGYSGTLVFYDNNGSNIYVGHSGRDFFANVHGGEAGNDVYTGGGGADIFDYTFAIGAMNGDTITDLDTDDVIDFQYNDAVYNGGGLLANAFIGSAAFSNVAGQYRYEVVGGTTIVQADTNGDGIADETLTISNGAFGLVETFAGSNILMRATLFNDTAGEGFRAGTIGNDVINMLAGNDFIAATRGIDFVDGGEGTDQLRFLMANTGRFTPPTGARTYTISVGQVTDSSGQLTTSFTNVEQVYLSTVGAGNFGDTINGSASNASLMLRLGNGNDTVVGSTHDDDITTGLGINSVDAGGGNDTVYTQFDNDLGATAYVTMLGGAVITTVNGVQTNSVVNAEVVGVQGLNFNTSVTTVNASGLTGFSGLLILWDNNGTNISIGSAGSDTFANIHGFEAGNDVYTGGGGADVFDYTWAIGAMDRDTITDFDSDDTIDLRYNNAVSNGGGLLANAFIGSAAFSNVAGQYRYFASGGQTFVQADTNGDGIADETLTIANGQFALGETFAGSNILHIIGTSGTSGNDTLTGTLGNDNIYAQTGNDIINGSQGSDYVNGGNGGGDRLFMNTGTASLFAAATGARNYTIGANSITDSSGTLNTSFTGVERISLSTVGNGNYNDIINASGYSSAHPLGLDIRLGNGNNQITGSATTDRIWTGFGANVVDGGAGYDYGFSQSNAASAVTIVVTSAGNSVITSANGVSNSFTNIEEVQVFGVGAAAVTLDASGYTDVAGTLLILTGHNGSDIMIGSAGNDYFANITGQVLGNDVYTGNGGADIYDYTYAADSMNGDIITDFDIDDVIDFRFNNLELGGSPLLANHFIGAAAFSGVAGQYRYQINGTQTVIQLDSNGDTIVDQTLTIANGAFMLAETFAGSNILTLAAVIDPLAGIVADGYVEGATLFIDTNGNMLLDAGEAWTVTGVGGSFTLNVNQAGTLVAVGGVNADTGLANTMTLAAPSGSSVVNPLTTLIQAVVEQGNSLAAAEAKVLAALGLDPTLDLLNLDLIARATDPLATEAQKAAALTAQKAAAIIANIVAAAEGATGAGASTEATLIDALAGLVTGTTAGTTIDLTDAATLTPLLAEALPTTSNVAAIAASVAVEGDVIAAATSIAAISDAQIAVNTIDYSLDNVFTGDGAINHLFGGGGNDTLYGLGGNDFLDGGTGNDFLDGGAGNDDMRGGTGDDIYIVDSSGDLVTEDSNQGIDTVRSSISYTLGANVENLQLLESALDGTGNGLANTITGNGLSNRLSGGAGDDTLIGGNGVDYFTGGSGNDIFVGEINATKVASKDGPISLDVIFDFTAGDKIDLRAIDAIAGTGINDAFTFKGTDANKLAGGLSIKVYDSVAGAEKALGMDIDGVAGKSPYSGPVTVVYGNVDGGAVDFAIALIGTSSVNASDFFL